MSTGPNDIPRVEDPLFYRVYKYDGERGEVEIDQIEGETYEMAKITADIRHGSDAYIK